MSGSEGRRVNVPGSWVTSIAITLKSESTRISNLKFESHPPAAASPRKRDRREEEKERERKRARTLSSHSRDSQLAILNDVERNLRIRQT